MSTLVAASAATPQRGGLRVKGNFGPLTLSLLLIVAGVPLLLALARVLALPGAQVPALAGLVELQALGELLNQSLSLTWVPPLDRPEILHLLLLPTAAVLIALARLTFGLRVLGLRAILLAIGFQEAGFLPSLVLIAIVVGTILLARPWMRRVRLPMYARMTVILCITAIIMVGALLLGPWLRSEVVWSVAFFPVIIMAMLAEGIAGTLARDNGITAAWRAAWTIGLAVVIALIGQLPAARDLVLHFPELMLTQLVAIILIAEFLDLRLLEGWPDRLSRLAAGLRPWGREVPRIVVARNRWNTGVIGRLGRPAPGAHRRRSVQPLVDALRGLGYAVTVSEADITLLRELQDRLPPDPLSGAPGGLVFNLAAGLQGNGRYCQLPAMLEMAGIAYTGPDPVAQARLMDRHALLSQLREAGVAAPRTRTVTEPDGDALCYPLLLRPRFEPGAAPRRCKDREQLLAALAEPGTAGSLETVIEEPVAGRELRVPLIGNGVVEALPPMEVPRGRRGRSRPAGIDDELAARVREVAVRAYRAAGCRDYARIDVRLAAPGNDPVVVDVRWDHVLTPRGSFARAAEAAGMGYAGLIGRIVTEAAVRCGVTAALPPPVEHRTATADDRRWVAP